MTETFQIVYETVNRFFEESISKDILDKAEDNLWQGELWSKISESGYLQAWDQNDPESNQITLIIAQLSGWHTLPLPLVETLAARQLAGEYIKNSPSTVFTIANPLLLENICLNGNKLSGQAKKVAFARNAEKVITVIEGRLIIAPSTVSSQNTNMAGEARDEILWENEDILNCKDSCPQQVINIGAFLRSAQICGGLQHALQKTISYATDRHQFGRPIGKFQSIQNYLSKAACLTAMANSALTKALESPSMENIAAAKACASEAASEVSALSHRVHGAMGFTHEYYLHYITRRLLSWREEFGSETWWHDKLGESVINSGHENLWNLITNDN